MQLFSEWLDMELTLTTNLLATVIIIVLVVLIRLVALRLVSLRIDDSVRQYQWRKGVTYALYAFALLSLGRVWLATAQGFATYLGLLTAGLAVALQDPIVNLVGWLFLIVRRPFEVGDRIQVGEHAGDVVDIRFFQFTMLEIRNWVDADQSTGRVLHVPNKKVFNESIANFHKGFAYIWHEIPVEVTFESDWRKAKDLIRTIIERHDAAAIEDARRRLNSGQRFLINYENLTPTVYTRVVASGVLLTARILVSPRQRRNMNEVIWEAILDAFAAEPTIDLAYPTQRIYFQPQPDMNH